MTDKHVRKYCTLTDKSLHEMYVPTEAVGCKKKYTVQMKIILCQFSKILKKLYNKRLEKCIDKNNILSTSQYGFRTNMSTSHALIYLLEEMSTSLDKKKYTLGVFIDFKKRKSFKEKLKIMVFGRRKINCDVDIKINTNQISQ